MGCCLQAQSGSKEAKYEAPAKEKERENDPIVPEPPVIKAEIKVTSTNDCKAIHSAIRWNKKPFDEIEGLIKDKAAANIVDAGEGTKPGTGNTPIHIASQNGHITLVNMLIAKGANVNSKNKKGNTAFHMALSYDYYDCCLALIAAGADIEIKNEAGHPAKLGLDGDKSLPLLALMASKTSNEALSALKAIKALGSTGVNQSAFASVGLKTKKEIKTEWTDEVQAEFKIIFASLSNDSGAPAATVQSKSDKTSPVTVTEAPVAKDAPTDFEVSFDFRSIHSAIRWNRKPFDEIDALVKDKSAANCVDSDNGNTPIHIASQNGHITLVNMLIAKGAKVNVKNKKGNTPLHMALSYDYYECCLALIAAEADLEDKNEAGHAAKFGLDGDKSLPLLALMASKTSADALSALATIKAQGGAGINQSAFASAGLKTKKEIKTEWTDEVQAEFKAILATL